MAVFGIEPTLDGSMIYYDYIKIDIFGISLPLAV